MAGGAFDQRRKTARLSRYDYGTPGAYFITICTGERRPLLSSVLNGETRLSEVGVIVQQVWGHLPDRFSSVALDAFVIMPNHVHGVLHLVGAGLVPAQGDAVALERRSLSEVIGAFKSLAATEVRRRNLLHGERLWQRNYYEHVVRNEDELGRIREYVQSNPANWELDEENPDRRVCDTGYRP